MGIRLHCGYPVSLMYRDGAAAESISGPSPSQVQQDPYMYTKQFQTKVVVGNDGSYDITEKINVRFLEDRHGIYRYIPSKGTIASYDKKGEIQKTPFYASVKLVRANETVDESSENGSTVFRFGDEDKTVREGIYKFEYLLTPKFQQKSYDNIYYNIFRHSGRTRFRQGAGLPSSFRKSLIWTG